MDETALRCEAALLRRFLEQHGGVLDHESHRSFPDKWCRFACSLLVRRLSELRDLKGVSLVNGQRRDASGQPENHYWLLVDELVVDITADQFSDFEGGAVFVGADAAWHAKFDENRCLSPVAGQLDGIRRDKTSSDLHLRFEAWRDGITRESAD